MINLLCLLCSMFIQFGSIGITPFDYSNYNYSDEIISNFSNILNYDLYNDFHAVYSTPNYATGYVVCPLDIYTSAADPFSCTFNNYLTNDNQEVIGYTVTYTNCRVYYNSGGQVVWADYQNGNTWYWPVYFDGYVPANASNYGKIMKINVDYLPFILNNVVFVTNGILPDDDIIGNSSIGVLDLTGHSQGNPMDSLQGLSFTAHSSSYIQSGHNTHVAPSSATPDFTNAEQNLLGQIVDNTNSIIENTDNLGGALETINSNIIKSASAIFNGISQFNNNFVTSYVYDEDKVNDTLENSSMFLFASTTTELTETIINESDVLLDAVHDMEEKQDLILYLDLTKWKVPVYSSSTGVNTSYVKPYNEVVQIDFSFLKETKSIWQPILLGVLYLALFMSIYFDLPNILRGANG